MFFEAIFDGDAGHDENLSVGERGLVSGDVQCGECVGTRTALGGVPKPLGVDDRLEIEKRALK
jgi:hypothetical protein